ncbi:caspase family protein [Leptolyngbya boryana CZ1]|uniref:Caspase family protein n=1 Tax=Leptolyngbya boryana CZ1 TaxID=3060204 RepID=A0AA96WQI3_LEPBY|nr:caspase family protein [Leptolyngbya boryana]WNZ44085.1 caspase family protein [Leptolyngbya boryana CZ1]
MAGMKRRHFLQATGSALATIGLSQWDVMRQGDRYGKVLAQGTPGRKLALLVGINGYSDSPLSGCVNDVLMQQKLLVHRFGFNPKDILIVSDDTQISQIKPTRSNILQAFEQHLWQARKGDVVVFHFSGHGSQVYDPNVEFEDKLNSTFVPIDRQVAQNGDRTIVSDIMGETLFLLMTKLQTENVTVVLDSCHSGGGKRGDVLIRAIGGGKNFDRSPEETAYQRKIRPAGMSDAELARLRRNVAKGVVISSTSRQQLAADQEFEGFKAGAFTYALTQYLWQATGNNTLESTIVPVSRMTKRISSQGQEPEFEAKKGSGNDQKPIYFLDKRLPPAEAIPTQIQGDRIELWLGGIAPRSLSAFGKGSTFTMVNPQGQSIGKVQLESRTGLNGVARLVGATRGTVDPQSSVVLQEDVRAIPKDLPMTIGLDTSLTAEEKQIATQTLPKLGQLIPVELSSRNSVGATYILGRVTPAIIKELQSQGVQPLPAVGSIALYSPMLELIPDSFSQAGESISEGLARLKPKFRALLAARLLKLVLNAESSRLKISAKMQILDGSSTEVGATAFTPRGGGEVRQQGAGSRKTKIINGIPQIPFGTAVRFDIQNQEDRDLYVTVFVVSSEGEMGLLFPNAYKSDIDSARISAGETRQLPNRSKGDGFKLVSQAPTGLAEVLIVASSQPIREALKSAEQLAKQRGTRGGQVLPLDKPLDFVGRLLQDVDRGGRGSRSLPLGAIEDRQVADAAQIAAVSITFQSVEKEA